MDDNKEDLQYKTKIDIKQNRKSHKSFNKNQITHNVNKFQTLRYIFPSNLVMKIQKKGIQVLLTCKT